MPRWAAAAMERKLAAILAADVVGYSRLMAADEEATLATLHAYRQTIGELVAEHGGRIFGTAGDSVVAEFPSPVQAVRTAVAIQRALNRRNADLAADHRMLFRIGVNLGDVVADGSDLLGDGVNVAARLQETAAPGGICIAGNVREQIAGKLAFPLAHLGERSLKNLPRPVPIFRVDWRLDDPAEVGVLGGTLALPDRPSIAVLPFVNMSGDIEQEYFADGLSEDIITALSRYRWFFVIARNSSFAYKGRAVDIKQVARELGVRYVLEGSVRKAGSRLRATGQLIDADTGVHLWAERYDRDMADIFAIQDEITESVVGAIEPEILMGEGRRAAHKQTANLDAYDCCMRGIWHHYQLTAEHIAEAISWQRRAIALDPSFARAHMALARALMSFCTFGYSDDITRDVAELELAAARTIALDDRDPYSHYAVFMGHLAAGRLQPALAAAQRIIDLSPNFAFGHFALGWVRLYLGHFEQALDPLFRALRLSPNDPLAFFFNSKLSLVHYHLGNLEEALHFAERALAVRRMHVALTVLVACLGKLGRAAEAGPLVAELQDRSPPDPEGYWRFVHPYADPAHREQLMDGLRRAGMAI
jgi:adenylate cyclase